MPGRDRTGPMGQGAMTGRGLGFCTGASYLEPGYGFFRRGMARGRGRGFGRFYPPVPETYMGPYYPEDEEKALRQQAENLKAGLKNIEARLAQLEKKAAKEGG